jgi:hypothetical protein
MAGAESVEHAASGYGGADDRRKGGEGGGVFLAGAGEKGERIGVVGVGEGQGGESVG